MISKDMQSDLAMSSLELISLAGTNQGHPLLESDPAVREEFVRFAAAAVAYAQLSVVEQKPPEGLRTRILEKIRGTPQDTQAPPSVTRTVSPPSGKETVPNQSGHFVAFSHAPWQKGKIPGSRVKVLSGSATNPRMVLLVELPPKTWFPEHRHPDHEELYLLTGEVVTEGVNLRAGDCFSAEPNSFHHALYTEGGCTALLILARSNGLMLIA